MTALDFTRPLLSDGAPVRILCTDGPGDWPVLGLIGEHVYKWKLSGAAPIHRKVLTQAPEPTKLQLREGGYYRRNDGQVTGPICREDGKWRSRVGQSFRDDGRIYEHIADGKDLVCEVTVADVPLDAAAEHQAMLARTGQGTDVKTTVHRQPGNGPTVSGGGSVDAPAPIPPPSPAYQTPLSDKCKLCNGKMWVGVYHHCPGDIVANLQARIAELSKDGQRKVEDAHRDMATIHRQSDHIVRLKKLNDAGSAQVEAMRKHIAELTKPQSQKQCAGWVNVYREGVAFLYTTKTLADAMAGARIACVPVQYLPGEGISS